MLKIPEYNVDFYSDEFIRNPWPHYAEMRQLGAVVWLPRHENFALTRHAEVSNALRDHDTFISGRGVAADAKANEMTLGNSAASDGERHTEIRRATSAPLLPGALEKVRDQIEGAADELIDRLAEQDDFDAIKDLATHLPLTIVRDLVGLPDFGRENMLRWANATFDLLGVQNERGRAAIEVFLEQRRFAQTQATPELLKQGSWTRRLFELVEAGALAPDLAPVAMRDYLNPSLDTTISATGQLIYQLGRNADQWRRLRAEPELARNAANEAVRMASPVRSFSRHTSRQVNIDGCIIPEGARVMMLFASANRDERVFENPDSFDISRNPRHHVGFGSGIHMCVGQHLAQMEMIALLKSMIPRVSEIIVGDPVVALNNTIYGFGNLPTTFVADRTAPRATSRPSSAPVPVRTLSARIAKREAVAEDVVALTLEPEGSESFPAWTPGAHIDLYIDEGLVRQYSLTGRNEQGRFQIAVQLDAHSTGGSRAVHSRLVKGSSVTISQPRNHFVLHEDVPFHALFSGGIGLTPILSMAWHLHNLGRDFVWHVSARTRSRLAWADILPTLPFAERIRLHFDDGEADQVFNAETELSGLPQNAHLYICGPKGYMAHVTDTAREVGVNDERVHLEHFGAEIDVNGDPFTIVANRSGRRIKVGPDETILSALNREGYAIETSCRNGVCGTCLTRVVEGKPDHRDMVLTVTEKAEGAKIAVCCSRSKSSVLVLDI
ncbi:cytochrome P450/oxidoreductase [Ensifer sp. ENS05]|uniref:cytochrome P450/oxidoreductase n=1 Tax=Ensifer sp. ENS05 TaxID=2769277 RepID=UPI00177AB103|nr:cytochrome P450/oxidoreductase [Ensifer sp. ENS05]MBD9596880.1 cytochrome P450/oxidoreductase [Ensifer sp. ENS05]